MSGSSEPPQPPSFPPPRRDAPYSGNIREQLPPKLGEPGLVYLAHPQHPNSALLILVGYSGQPLWHRLLVDAAYVLSGNKSGYLCTSPVDSSLRIPRTQETLPPGIYYYFVDHPGDGEASNNWKVVQTFEDWDFPHSKFSSRHLPSIATGTFLSHWRMFKLQDSQLNSSTRSEMTQAVRARDESTCVLSAFKCNSIASETAHLVPKTALEWFGKRGMDKYGTSLSLGGELAIDDASNGIILRRDLHGLFDSGISELSSWLAYPAPTSVRYIASFCLSPAPDNPQHADQFHNVPLNLQSSVSEAYLFARFAWSIFRLMHQVTPDSRAAEATAPQAARHLSKHDRSPSSGQTGPDDLFDTPRDDGSGRKSVKTAHDNGTQNVDTVGTFSDDPKLDKLAKKYKAAHPAISAIGEPKKVSPGDLAWLAALDDDERRRYEFY